MKFAQKKNAEKAKKEERRIDKLKRDELKTRRDWLNEAQVVFNRWIRLRDYLRPCISCGKENATWDAGHYRSVGAAPQLRFDEMNVHKQCVHCNQHKSGNAIEMRIGLVNRYGVEVVERLESTNESVKWTIEDAQRIKREYANKIKQHNRDAGII